MNPFEKRKEDVLGKKDKSSIGEWDKHILKLCSKINKDKDYYTTSSCAGRILLIIDQDKKAEDLFLNVWHEKIGFDELKKAVEGVLKDKKANAKFKQEPFILHVACRDEKSMKDFLEMAKKTGIKRVGIISFGERFIVELNSSEKIEFPIISDGKLLVGDEFLRLVIKKSNENLEKSWEKIGRLEKGL